MFDWDNLVVHFYHICNLLTHLRFSVCVCVRVFLCLCLCLPVCVPLCVCTGIGFLKEWQRLNVAITRAKFAVWIVGHAETLGADSEWKHLIDFTKEKK